MIIILGSSGMVGSHIANALKQKDYDIHLPTRNDLANLDQLTTMINHETIIINAIGIAPGFGNAKHKAVYEVQKAFLDRCIELGAQKIISLSALSQYPNPTEIPYLKYKYSLDQHLLENKITSYIVRPSLVYADNGASTKFFKKLSKLPILAFPKNPNYAVSPIHIDDLVNFIITLLPLNLPSQIFEVGTEVITLGNYLKRFNPKLIILPLPEWMMATSMNVLGTVLPSIAGKYAFALLRAGSVNTRDDYELIMGKKARKI